MPTQYQSFLARIWNLGDDTERIEIEHIQSGRRRVPHSRADAVEWMRTIDQIFGSTPGKEDTGIRRAWTRKSQAVDESRSKEARG